MCSIKEALALALRKTRYDYEDLNINGVGELWKHT